MRRLVLPILAVSTSFAIAAAALAGDHHHHQGRSDNQGSEHKQSSSGRGSSWSDFFSSFHKHHEPKQEHQNEPRPIDPGRGDGRVPVEPKPLTPPVVRDHRDGSSSQGQGGFVFVNGHWERAKAPKAVSPYPADAAVRDHRTTGSFPAGATIRDHRTTTAPIGPTIRDHRSDTSNAPGGVTVTVTDRNSTGPIVRDHRTQPVVRDHRTQPVVRDHRSGQ